MSCSAFFDVLPSFAPIETQHGKLRNKGLCSAVCWDLNRDLQNTSVEKTRSENLNKDINQNSTGMKYHLLPFSFGRDFAEHINNLPCKVKEVYSFVVLKRVQTVLPNLQLQGTLKSWLITRGKQKCLHKL